MVIYASGPGDALCEPYEDILVNDTRTSALDPPEEDVYAHGYLNAAMSDHHDTHDK